MRRFLFAPVAVALVLAGCKSETQKDEEALQGTWIVSSREKNGLTITPPKGDASQQATFTFSGNSVKVQLGDKVSPTENSFKLDASQKPKHIDMITKKKDKDGKVTEVVEKGIYALNGDSLTICATDDGGEARPSAFSGGKGTGTTLLELKRKK